jgi:hypothetical protein
MDKVSMVFMATSNMVFLPNVCGARKILSSDDTLHACDRTVRAPWSWLKNANIRANPQHKRIVLEGVSCTVHG